MTFTLYNIARGNKEATAGAHRRRRTPPPTHREQQPAHKRTRDGIRPRVGGRDSKQAHDTAARDYATRRSSTRAHRSQQADQSGPYVWFKHAVFSKNPEGSLPFPETRCPLRKSLRFRCPLRQPAQLPFSALPVHRSTAPPSPSLDPNSLPHLSPLRRAKSTREPVSNE